MYRRAVVAGAVAVVTAGCTDRVHDLAASTPRDIAVRSRYVPEEPLVESESVRSRPPGVSTHVRSFDAREPARSAMRSGAETARSFVDATDFVRDGGDAVLVITQRLTDPGIDLRLGSVSRIGGRSIRIGVDEVGHRPGDGDPAVQTLLVRLADDRGPPRRVVVSVEDERVGVTV